MQNIGRASFPSNAILKHINYSKPSLLVGNESFNSSLSGFWLLEVFLLSPLIQKNKSYHKTNLLKAFICIIFSSMAYPWVHMYRNIHGICDVCIKTVL